MVTTISPDTLLSCKWLESKPATCDGRDGNSPLVFLVWIWTLIATTKLTGTRPDGIPGIQKT